MFGAGLTAGWAAGGQTPHGSYGPAFFVSLGIFVITLVAIAVPYIHETAAALLGAVLLWLVHYIGGTFRPSLHIAGFAESMAFVDWNVVFLVMGMMIFVAVINETGVLRWLAYRAFRLARGNAWLLGGILVFLAAVTSSLLNNATAILVLVPLSIQIAATVGVHPFAYVIPEVLAANIGGAATLIGDPPSTIVGSALGLGFPEYALLVAPVVLLSLLLLVAIAAWIYRQELRAARGRVSPALNQQLEQGAQIADIRLLCKVTLVGLATLALFFVGDPFGLPPGVIALTGATFLVVWVRPDVHHMLREVDWTTLFFYIGIFIVVGGLERAGVMRWVAGAILEVTGDRPSLVALLTPWVAGLISGAADNVLFTITALPIVDLLGGSLFAAKGSQVLYWGLVLGADLGGNLTHVGGAANIVAVGLLAQAGYRMSFGSFLRVGLPVTVATLAVTTVWLLITF